MPKPKVEPVPLSITQEAHSIVTGARNETYGNPADDFSCAADILRALVKRRYDIDVPFDADFIPLVMICAIKGTRQAFHHQRDNLVDMAGYAQVIDMIRTDSE